MPWSDPYHTATSQERPVYHVYPECGYGRRIQPVNREPGPAGRRMCQRWWALAREQWPWRWRPVRTEDYSDWSIDYFST